jgi:CRISPR-associated protein Cmr4
MKEYDLMFVNVITPLHNGSGEGLGIVDNPIMRERTTQFPIIQATSIKGVLRDAYEEKNKSDVVVVLFGPKPGKGEEHAGAVTFGDGQILAFPVRSLKGCFVWITSPLVLWRFYQMVNIIDNGQSSKSFQNLSPLIAEIQSGKAKICPSGKMDIALESNQSKNGEINILLEEFSIKCIDSKKLEAFSKEISPKIYDNADTFLKKEFEKKLVVLDDDMFRYFVTNATEIVPNIRIGKNGTTEIGSLRYTEFLPSETIMYSILTFDKARTKTNQSNAAKVKEEFHKTKLNIIQLGGDETTGKGIVKIALLKGGAANDRPKH